MDEDLLLVERRDGIARLTLNRPARLNCINRTLNRRLRDTLEALAGDTELRVVLLTGAGRAFCTGQDLGERHADLQQDTPDLGAALADGFNRIVAALRALEVPVVAAVNGTAAGAGANLALACDVVLAARSAQFTQAFVAVGLSADSGGSWTLPRLVGDARARGLLLTGMPLNAEQAEAWGMIWRCVDDVRLMPEAEALLAALAARPRHALAAIKRALNAAYRNDFSTQLGLEAELQRANGRHPAYREAVERFISKQKGKA
jgi:2-(1,2-epoxy-1,2-dihydrophenyl)acetyl-CoA isomerase